MTQERWTTDKPAGFNVIERREDGVATVCQLQPHAKIRERAALIAAAPDLLEAAKRSIQYLMWAIHDSKEQGIHQDTINIAERDLEMVKAAIKKARGDA